MLCKSHYPFNFVCLASLHRSRFTCWGLCHSNWWSICKSSMKWCFLHASTHNQDTLTDHNKKTNVHVIIKILVLRCPTNILKWWYTNSGIFYNFLHIWMNKEEENQVPRTLFEARMAAGSTKYKQSKTVWNCENVHYLTLSLDLHHGHIWFTNNDHK